MPTLTSEAVPAADPLTGTRNRLPAVDTLRGLVMVIMALDHTRDFFSSAQFDPTDLAHTTPLLFFTRWITHFCAPVFVFLAGAGAYLSLQRGRSRSEVSRFLLTRGFWLIFLEVFVISPFGWSFNLNFGFTRLQVIWVIGMSMLVMAGLVRIWASSLIGGAGVALIVTHDLFDGRHAARLGAGAEIWRWLHQVRFVHLWPHETIASLYPLIPWVGVMMAGYGAGGLLRAEPNQRRRIFLVLGALLTLSFILLRAANVYGDPSPWSVQANPAYTVMSFLRCSKYPPSLLYLLMTLGPALMLLGAMEGARNWLALRLQVFGRVPLFYYLLHLPLLHGLAIGLSLVTYGSARWLLQDEMAASQSNNPLPHGYGYGLPVVYGIWLAAVLLLYPACRWYAGVKQRRRELIFRYL